MRVTPFFLAIAVGAATPSPSAQASETPSRISVRDLNCEFTVPGDYKVLAGSRDGTLELYDRHLSRRGRVTLTWTDGHEDPPGGTKIAQSERRGHLTISRREWPSASDSDAPRYFTTIEAFSRLLMIAPEDEDLAQSIIAECLASVDPAIVQAADRQHAGCATLLGRDRLQALMRQLRPQPVFADGKERGWRIYPEKKHSHVAKAGLRQGDLVTHVCGAHTRTLLAIDGPVCCSTPVGETIQVLVDRDGQVVEISLPMPPAASTGQ